MSASNSLYNVIYVGNGAKKSDALQGLCSHIKIDCNRDLRTKKCRITKKSRNTEDLDIGDLAVALFNW